MKYQDLNRKQKIEYIWDYYKLHIIAGCVGLIVLIYTLNAFIFNPPPKSIFNVAIMGNQVDMTKTEDLSKELEHVLLGEDVKSSVVTVEAYFMDAENANPNMVMASSAKFMANLQENMIDIFIIDENQFKELNKAGIYMELDKVLDQKTLEQYEDSLVRINNKIYGIDISSNPALSKLIFGEEKNIISIYVNTQHLEDSLKIYQWFLK